MTLDDVFSRLWDIDHAAQKLLRDAGFSYDTGFAENVCLPSDDPDCRFRKESAELLLEPLEEMHEQLSYLKAPASREYVLQRFPGGRYGYLDEKGYRHPFTCGHMLEAMVDDGYGHPRWVRARIEHDGSGYFLHGHREIPLDGLSIRERRCHG